MNENDDSSLFGKRFDKFLRKKGKSKRPNFNPKKNFKKKEESSPIPRCYDIYILNYAVCSERKQMIIPLDGNLM